MVLSVSVVIPAKNEEAGLARVLPEIRELLPEAEVIVVNDGSTDRTKEVALEVPNVICVDHPVSIGNGGAIKSGARRARNDVIVFMDADGQHMPKDIPRLLAAIEDGYDMVCLLYTSPSPRDS